MGALSWASYAGGEVATILAVAAGLGEKMESMEKVLGFQELRARRNTGPSCL